MNLPQIPVKPERMGLLKRLTDGKAIVIATMRSKELDGYRPSDELRGQQPRGGKVIARFNEISLELCLTSPELDRVRAAVDDPAVLAAVDHYGLAEYLGAGPEALDKFERGETTSPIGHALVQAAIDWSRTGLIHPVPQQVLTTMLPAYLADRPDVLCTDQTINEGLTWATKPINQTVALLGQVDANQHLFKAFDYLIDQFTHTDTLVPDSMWILALEQSEPAELNRIGLAAYQADKLTIADTAYRRVLGSAADSGDADMVSRILSILAQLYVQIILKEIIAVFPQASDSSHAEVIPGTAINMGGMLQKRGDLERPKTADQRVIDSGHALAAYSRGRLLEQQGDVEGAKAAYQQAIDSGNATLAPLAAYDLLRLSRSTLPSATS